MGQYTHTSFAAAATIVSGVSSGIGHELLDIAAAHNLHAAADIATTGSVSRSALVTDKGYFTIPLINSASVVGPTTTASIAAYAVVPFACQVIAAQYLCASVAASGNILAVYKEGDPDDLIFDSGSTTYTSSTKVLSLTGPYYTDLSAGDVLTLRLVVTTGESTSFSSCILLVKAVHD